MLYLIYRTNSAPFVRAKDTSLHNNCNRYLPFPQGLFLICEKLSKIGHEDRRPLAKDGYPKDKPPDLSASRFEDQGACRMLLGALTSDLLQDTSDISIDADGFCSNFSGCIGFPQIDAGVGSVFPGGGHTPEGIFDDAGGAYTGAQVQEQYFGALVPAQEVRIALRCAIPALVQYKGVVTAQIHGHGPSAHGAAEDQLSGKAPDRHIVAERLQRDTG